MLILLIGLIIIGSFIILIIPESPIRKSLKRGFVVGVILSIINLITLGLPGIFIFRGFLSLLPAPPCSGEFCFGFEAGMGSIFFVTFVPLLFVFLAYIIDKQSFPFTWKKCFLIIITILITLFVYAAGVMEYQLKHFELNNKDLAHHTYYKPGTKCEMLYSHFPFATNALISDCYGFFAAQKNDLSLCDNINGIDDGIYGKESAKINCISSYSIQKNDVNYCTKSYPDHTFSCKYKYYVIKGDKKGCDALPSNQTYELEIKDKCLRNINLSNQLMFKYLELRDHL